MKIVVLIKQVPETSNVKMDPVSGTMIRTGTESIINPLDLYAIETAIRMKEQFGGTITIISMGPPQAINAVREAIAMGCDDGILLSDRAFGGADTWATAYTLAQSIRKLDSIDLILCGERATDGDTGQVGPGVAAMLNLPLVTYVNRIEVEDDGTFCVERQVEGGTEIVAVGKPLVLTVIKEIGVPRLPTLRGILQAREANVEIWGQKEIAAEPSQIGLKGSPTRVVRVHRPQVSRSGKKIFVKEQGDLDNTINQILELIKRENIR